MSSSKLQEARLAKSKYIGDNPMAGGEQQASRQRLPGGEGTVGIFTGDDDGVTAQVDHGQISGEDGSADEGREDDVELAGENSSYDGHLRRRLDALFFLSRRL